MNLNALSAIQSAAESLALTPDERKKIARNRDKILGAGAELGVATGRFYQEIDMAIHRDVQAQRIRPNVKVPSRRRLVPYIRTMATETGSLRQAILSILSHGSWTTSGGSHKLAEDQGIDLAQILGEVADEKGNAQFLEVGAGYAGLKSKENGEMPRGIAKLIDRFNGELGATIQVHFTNLSDWHDALPAGVHEHQGFVASTIKKLTDEGVDPETVDVIYSQCAAYFDLRIDAFIQQAARLLARSSKGGLLIFNGNEEDDQKILRVASQSSLSLVTKVLLGGMNGIFYVFKKN